MIRWTAGLCIACLLGCSYVPGPQGLSTTVRPDLLEEARTWPTETWAVRWLDEHELYLEEHHPTIGPYSGHNQAWIQFSPPADPEVSIRCWTAEGDRAAWFFRDVEGTCSISSDGSGCGSSDGPDLALQCEFVGDHSGSPNHGGFSVLLTREQLLRNER